MAGTLQQGRMWSDPSTISFLSPLSLSHFLVGNMRVTVRHTSTMLQCWSQNVSRASFASKTLRRISSVASEGPYPALAKPSNEAWYDAVVAQSDPVQKPVCISKALMLLWSKQF